MKPLSRSILLLASGDTVAIAVITLIGFASHGELQISFAGRMLTTFAPLLAGWFLIAPWLGLFDQKVVSNPRQLWRPVLAMFLAAPLTAVLRAALLNSAALPLFALILGGSAALGMVFWRGAFLLAKRAQKT
ncbi:MAG: DUF3054 family protein [Anaerolineales bacterium]